MMNYSFEIETQRPAKEIYELLLQVEKWWSGIYDETIEGESQRVNDAFTFSAGGGMHRSSQKLLELRPYKEIVWEVTESNLSFLNNPNEWAQTRLHFDIIERAGGKTVLVFTHEGLVPEIECYGQCSNAWSLYFENLRKMLQ